MVSVNLEFHKFDNLLELVFTRLLSLPTLYLVWLDNHGNLGRFGLDAKFSGQISQTFLIFVNSPNPSPQGDGDEMTRHACH